MSSQLNNILEMAKAAEMGADRIIIELATTATHPPISDHLWQHQINDMKGTAEMLSSRYNEIAKALEQIK